MDVHCVQTSAERRLPLRPNHIYVPKLANPRKPVNSFHKRTCHTDNAISLLLAQIFLILVENTPPQRTDHRRPRRDVILTRNISSSRRTDWSVLLTHSPFRSRPLTPVDTLLPSPLALLVVVLGQGFGQRLHLTLTLAWFGGVREVGVASKRRAGDVGVVLYASGGEGGIGLVRVRAIA